jgi:hypothetical protein
VPEDEDFEPLGEDGAIPPPTDSPESYGKPQAEDPFQTDPAAPRAPNSFYLPFWRAKNGARGAYLSWQSDSPIAVLALVILVFILLAMIVFGVVVALTPGRLTWIDDVEKVLGQALLTVLGAIVGAASQRAVSKKDD